MQKSDAARIIAGLTPAETKQSSAPTSVHVMSGEVVGNSESGKVQIRMDGDVVSPDDDQIIEVDAIGGLEEGDTATILLTGQPGRAMTPMAMGSSGSVDRIVERIKTIEADYVKATEIEAEVGTFGYLKAADLEAEVAEFGYLKANELEAEVAEFGYLKADDLEAEVAEFGYLKANSATITDLQADTAKIHNLSANDISAATGYIHDLTSSNVTAQNIIADHGDFSTVKANAAKVANLTAQELEADHATIANLDTSYAQIDMANVNNAWIANGLIKDAAIKSEMVESISANQLTAGEIDADEITVRNLRASSLTVQTADGYVYVGDKRIPTKEFIDSLKDELQNEIDGAIETFTVSAVPTLNNTPANDWVVSGDAEATRKLRAKHVGDIAYVVNSSSAQNGYCYRFAYDATNQEFKWVLIKDSDVTAALSRLSTAEGKITGLETFESNTTSWIEDTDEGLETIRTNHTNLAGIVDKTVVETKQLWFTKANTTAPNKPTAAVTSTSTAGNAWRVVVPAWNASYPNYYYCLQYKLADGTYAWSDVVRDIAMGESQQQGRKGVADAATADGKAVSAQNTANANIKSSVQLWFTKANSTAPDKPSAQVTTNSASTTNAWNLAIPTYNSSYPHYFYCYQQQKGDGTYQWSDVVYDRSVTEAQAKAQAALPSSAFTTFQSTTFKNLVDTVEEQSSTITQLSDSLSSVGNILSGTVANPSNWIVSAPSGASYTKEAYGNAGVKVTFNSVGGYEWLYSQPIAVTSGNKYMVFFDYTVGKDYTSTSGKMGYGLSAYSGSNAPYGTYDDTNERFLGKAEFPKTASGDRVLKGSFTFTATSDSIILGLNGGHIADNQTGLSFTIDNLVVGETLSTTSNTVNQVKQTATDNSARISNLTTTLGINADGTQSSTAKYKYNQLDQTLDGTISRVGATETKLETISNPNLSPFFSMAPYRTATSYDGGYWQPTNDNWLMGGVTRLSDGWAHVTRGASTRLEVAIPRIESLSAGDKATLMVEWRNITVTGSPNLYARNYPENCQFNLPSYETTWNPSSSTSGSRLIIMTVNSTADGDMNWNTAINLGMVNGSGVSFDGDLRISLYEGEYDGPYKPYVDQSLIERVSTAETSIEQTANNVLIKATKSDTTAAQGGQHLIQSLINVAPEGVKIAADKVNIEGAAIFTNGRLSSTSLNNAYDAKGSASAVQQNLDNLQVGGSNLYPMSSAVAGYIKSSAPMGDIVPTPSNPQHSTSDFIPVSEGDVFTLQMWNPNLVTNTSNSNRCVCWYDSSKAYISIQGGTGDATGSRPNGKAYWSFTCDPAPANAAYARFGFIIGPSTNVIDSDIKVKVERGNKPTDWSPAPEDQTAYVDSVQVGGRNLVWDTAWNDVAHRWHTWGSPTTREIVEIGGKRWLHLVSTSASYQGYEQGYSYRPKDNEIAAGDQVTVSVTAYAASACKTSLVAFHWLNSSNTIVTQVWPSFDVTTTPQRFHATFTVPSGATRFNVMVGDGPAGVKELWISEVKFEKGNRATDWTPAPEDVDASIATAQSTANSAIKRSQRIYYRSSTDQPPTSMPTAWVTESGNKWAANRTTATNWTTKVTPISNGTGSSVTKYLYLWTCIQYQLADNSAIQYSTVLLDDSTTVIDGGKIITGSLSANSINASSGTFDTANIPALTADHIKANVIDAVNNGSGTINADKINVSQISIGDLSGSIGGRNLVYDTANWSKWAKTSKVTVSGDVLTCANTDTSSGFQRANGWFIPAKADVMDREIAVSFDVKKTDATALDALVFQMFTTSAAPKSVASGNIAEGTRVFKLFSAASTQQFVIENASDINASSWTRVVFRFVPSEVFNTAGYTELTYLALYLGIRNVVGSAQFRRVKVEYGSRSTDWTPAPEDQSAYVDDSINGLTIGGRNLWGRGSECASLSGMTVSGFSITTESGYTCAHASGALKTTKTIHSVIPFTPKANEIVTISGYVLVKNIVRGTTNPMCEFYPDGVSSDGVWRAAVTIGCYIDGVYMSSISSVGFDRLLPDSKWHHVAMVYQWPDYDFSSYNRTPWVFLRDCTGDLYVRHLKFERGNKATDWTPAPEDVSQMVKIDTTSRSFTTAQWKTYGAVGHSENWTTGTSYDNSGIHVGDTAYLTGTVSDGVKGTATIIGTVTAVNGANGSTSIAMSSTQLIFGGDSVDAASKTATTYLTDGGSNGLMVHPSSDANTGVLITDKIDIKTASKVMNRIDTSGMTLYDGNGVADSNIVAKFAGKLVELGKGSTDAVIKFCNGMGDLSYNSDTKFLNLNSLRLSNYAKSNGTDMAASQIAAHFDSSAGTNLANVLSEADSSHARVMVSATYPISGGDPKQASIESYANGTEGYITFYANSFIFSGPGISDGGQTIKAIYAGSTVVNLSNGKWLSLADPTVVAQKLGSGASQGNTICIAQNGGHESYSGVVTGAMGSDGSARAYIYPNHTGYIRINFILIRFA